MLAGSFLPWLASGTADRSSYELLGVIDRLGFSPDGVVGWAVRLWPLLPLLLVVTVVSHHVHVDAGWLGTVRSTSTALAALYAGSVALAVRLAPDVGLLRPRYGSWITLAGAIVLATSLVLSIKPSITSTAKAGSAA